MTKYIGGLWEEDKWELLIDESVWIGMDCTEPPLPCPHAHSAKNELRRRYDGTTYDWWVCTVPRVIVAWNEGGYNTTGVCLDCVLEVAKTL